MKALIIGIIIVIVGGWLFFARPADHNVPSPNLKMEKVTFNTSDGVTIVGNYYPTAGEAAVLLLHQFAKDKNSWEDLPTKLNQAGIAVLAIDLRGHGESGGSKDDLAKAGKDVAAAVDFLKTKGKNNLAVVGASVGANLALVALANEAIVTKAVALSPGLEYKGIASAPAAPKIAKAGGKKLLIVASAEDDYSFKSSEQINTIVGAAGSEFKRLNNAGHGTNMFAANPELKSEIVDFLAR